MDTNKLSGIINAYINGGKIKISNLLKTINNEEARNLGVLNLSKEERENILSIYGQLRILNQLLEMNT